MKTELRLHGHIDDTIEYFATAASQSTDLHHFYQKKERKLRFFAPGNEFILTEEGIHHCGNGGTFCEYMFGVDQPLSDLAKEDVRNRLVLYGTHYNNGQLCFSDNTDTTQTYEQIFFEGNAVSNNFFFLSGPLDSALEQQQKFCLKFLGKALKRTDRISEKDDTLLISSLLGPLPPSCTLYVFRLINKHHLRYQEHFAELYSRHRSIPDDKFADLQNLADELGIDQYQQERIRIDVMYKHPDNRPIVNDYKKVLIDCNRQGYTDKAQRTRLNRLKTLSVRNKIPAALFYALDDMLAVDQQEEQSTSNDISTAKQILGALFQGDAAQPASISNTDMVSLLLAKRYASQNRDHVFEELLLETGKTCDEKIRDGADLSLLETFSAIITFFDRYDSASAHIGQLAFMENFQLTEEQIRSLLGNRDAFNELQTGLFDDLFFRDILQNKYLGRFGRRKMGLLRTGLQDIEAQRLTATQLSQQIGAISSDERLYQSVFNLAKERIRNFYSGYSSNEEQSKLLKEINTELRSQDVISQDIPLQLFRDVILNIKTEAIYIHNMLPKITFTKDRAMREDFLANSGLDRFYVEELEREYFTLNKLDPEDLAQLRAGADT
ncbi:MAG: TIGR04442 family protein [Desulfuromonas sp.]|nr:MAG: TIGR04442 family protein [Desulfuromonas sp.]